jgi:hypothetical protein
MMNRLLLLPLLLTSCAIDLHVGFGHEPAVDISSLDNWRGYKKDAVPEQWVVEDGAIYLTGGGGGDLITREQYESFDLTMEWKISSKGNSGVMYHVSETDGPTYFTGPEMQVLDNVVANGDLLHSAGADYALHAPEADNTKPVGEWNTARMRVDGPQVTYWLNGVQQCTYELWSEDWSAKVAASKFKQWPGFGMNKSGHIALQDHGNPVWFRNIAIKTL